MHLTGQSSKSTLAKRAGTGCNDIPALIQEATLQHIARQTLHMKLIAIPACLLQVSVRKAGLLAAAHLLQELPNETAIAQLWIRSALPLVRHPLIVYKYRQKNMHILSVGVQTVGRGMFLCLGKHGQQAVVDLGYRDDQFGSDTADTHASLPPYIMFSCVTIYVKRDK